MSAHRLLIILFTTLGFAMGIFGVSYDSNAQQIIEVRGLILNADTKQPLPFASISSVKFRKGYPSDEHGRFSFEIERGDTLRISFLGYREKLVPIVDEIVFQPRDLVVELQPRVYELRPVTVRDLRDLPGFIKPSDEDREAIDIIGLPNLPDGPRRPLNYYKVSLGMPTGNAGMSFGVGVRGAITALLSNFDNYYKQLKKLEILEAMERQEKAVEQLYLERFSREWVGEITKLEGFELDNFMLRYRPHPVFLATANEYYLTEYVFEKLELYKTLKKGQR
jgi:hypothetical protein